jgi:hypothetical protein
MRCASQPILVQLRLRVSSGEGASKGHRLYRRIFARAN